MPATIGDYDLKGIYKVVAQRNNAGTIAETELPLMRSADFEMDEKEIEFAGSGDMYKYIVVEGLSIALATDASVFAALKSVYGKTEVTTGLPTEEAVRMYMLDQADSEGAPCGLVVYCTAVRRDTLAACKVKFIAPRGILSPITSFGLETREKGPMEFTFSARKATKDIAGAALPGVDAGGAFWAVAELN